MQKAKKIPVSIRYGRISHSWNETYTMIFSLEENRSGRLGTAYLIPLENNPVTIKKIIDHSFILQSAERKKKGKWENLDWDWGCIGILVNPALNNNDRNNLKDTWTNFLSVDFDSKRYYKHQEQNVLDKNGMLKLPWIPEYDPFDFILAAVTKANAERLDPENIAGNMIKANNYEYFINNLKHGIRTFQDKAIMQSLKNAGIQLDI